MYLSQYTISTEEKQKGLTRHQFLKNRHFYFFKAKSIKLLSKYERWRKVAVLKLSRIAKQRLEWLIYYETKSRFNASLACRYFGITPKTFYKWKKLFDPLNLRSLEDRDKVPKNVKQWEVTPEQEQRIIQLKKQHIRWGKEKTTILYW